MSWAAELQATLMNQTGVKCKVGSDPTEWGTVWHIAEQSRSRQHIPPAEWDVPTYVVVFPYNVRESNQWQNGAEVINMVNGLKGVIRFMNDATTEGDLFTITVLVLVLDR